MLAIHLHKPVLTLFGMCAALGSLVIPAVVSAQSPQKPVDFEKDVRPILSDNCYTCHGFDAQTRMAGLRLDTREGATQLLKSGKASVVPGKSAESELIRRVVAENALRMPPAATGKKLTPEQIDILRRWIDQGANYEQHWAFVPPKRPAVPKVKNPKWVRNPIDAFILSRLEKEKLQPSPEADRRTLIRRLSYDLRGLPPTIAEVQQFLGDTSPNAYEKLVDRFLADPRYGERMALMWLDVSRYADTHGYHIDSHRDMWPWRDWVIRAFNRNQPFDQFTVEQLAGDLLPNPTQDQLVATGFNRNHPINFEGGAIPEEYHAAYVFDRVDTTSTVWMGLTVKCAQCHDHKYEPISQKEFYQFFAFFNNVAEQGLDGQRGNARPFMKVPSPEQKQQLAAFDQQIQSLDQQIKARMASVEACASPDAQLQGALANLSVQRDGLAAHFGFDAEQQVGDALRQVASATVRGKAAWTTGRFRQALSLDGQSHVDLGSAFDFERDQPFSYGAWINPKDVNLGTVLSRMDESNSHRGWDLYLGGGKVFAHLIHQWEGNAIRVNTKAALAANKWQHVFVTYDGSGKAAGVKIYIDGKPQDLDITHDKLSGTIRTEKPAVIGRRTSSAPFNGSIDELRVYRRALSPQEVEQLAGLDPVRQILTTAPETRSEADRDQLTRYYLSNFDETYRKLNTELADVRKQRTDLDNSIPTTMVMQELEKPRDTHILVRGEYDKKGEKVLPGTPAVLPALHVEDRQPNRLDLAKWLIDPNHPLTARVAVNRFWQLYFGLGIVPTSENFGVQGERPTHPELLDWLATEFIRTGWDVKGLQKLIVTSATYRQVSRTAPELREKDPDNRLLARGPRHRLPAEFIRDQALFVSGLMTPKIGGPSVRPYQPAGLWEEIAFGGGFTAQTYQQDHGEALYRRSMYTFWKRTCPPPSLQALDAPEREFCVVQRSTTNTPLQALVLMNDPTYVEASRKLAERLLTEIAALPNDRIRYAYRLVLARLPNNDEIRVLRDLYEQQLAVYRQNPEAALKLLSVGESKRNEKLDPAELAAWTTVSSALLNLDEAITKQ